MKKKLAYKLIDVRDENSFITTDWATLVNTAVEWFPGAEPEAIALLQEKEHAPVVSGVNEQGLGVEVEVVDLADELPRLELNRNEIEETQSELGHMIQSRNEEMMMFYKAGATAAEIAGHVGITQQMVSRTLNLMEKN